MEEVTSESAEDYWYVTGKGVSWQERGHCRAGAADEGANTKTCLIRGQLQFQVITFDEDMQISWGDSS